MSNHYNYSFEELTRLKKKDLDRIMEEGAVPEISTAVGYDFKGWNLNPITKLSKTLKFKKGFFGQPGLDHAWGYNVPVQQNKFDEPWIAEPNEENPRRYFFYKVLRAFSEGNYKHPRSMIIDYRKWDGYFFLNPAKYVVDYMIHPDPDNTDLMIGKSYLKTFLGEFFLGYFILERQKKSNYKKTTPFLKDSVSEMI